MCDTKAEGEDPYKEEVAWGEEQIWIHTGLFYDTVRCSVAVE